MHPASDTLEFTRSGKAEYDGAPVEPFTDAGSRALRAVFPRGDYVMQNAVNGAAPIRGAVPRVNIQRLRNCERVN